jgi:hypothetical protein
MTNLRRGNVRHQPNRPLLCIYTHMFIVYNHRALLKIHSELLFAVLLRPVVLHYCPNFVWLFKLLTDGYG